MCASMQATCSLLQGYKFVEPLASRRAEHEKCRKGLKERWQKERKRIQEAVALLLKSKAGYMQRTQEYERCRDALRIAEQVNKHLLEKIKLSINVTSFVFHVT